MRPSPTSEVSVGPGGPPAPVATGRLLRLLTTTTALAVGASIVLRLWPRSALWLDEAQAVAIARLPIADIPAALRADGAPPLYYVVLHVWMRLVGDSDVAVRSLSVLASLVTLVVLPLAAKRLAGPTAAVAALVLLAANPFAIRYATEGRMYAFVVLEVSIGLLVLPAALRRPDPGRLVGVALVTASLLLTHYWAFYLLAAVGLVLVVVGGRHPERRRAVVRVLGAMVAGLVAFAPWWSSFRFQAAHTGTPWSRAAGLRDLVDVLPTQSGISRPDALVLGVLLVGLVVLAARPGRRREALPMVAVVVVCPLLALVGSRASHSAFVARYTSVVFPVLVLLAALGVARLRDVGVRLGVLTLAAPVALPISVQEAGAVRTPGAEIADALEARAEPGDVVVFCPDQLGPSVFRALDAEARRTLTLGVAPDWRSPERVDWIDYADRYRSADPRGFARAADERAGSGTVWLVYSDLYPPTQATCSSLRRNLARLRRDERWVLADRPGAHLDHGGLVAYPARFSSLRS